MPGSRQSESHTFPCPTTWRLLAVRVLNVTARCKTSLKTSVDGDRDRRRQHTMAPVQVGEIRLNRERRRARGRRRRNAPI